MLATYPSKVCPITVDSPPKRVSDVVEEFTLLKIIDNHVKGALNVPRWYVLRFYSFAWIIELGSRI